MATETRDAPGAWPRPQQIDFADVPITSADTVVDVGCGSGEVCVYAGHQGAAVVGIDVEPTLVEKTAEAMKAVPARSFRGIVSDADPIPLPDASATLVVATEVMEHVERPERFLAELVRIVRPGGRILLSVPDPVSEGVIRGIAPEWYWRKPLHINVFQHDELDAMFHRAGLEIEGRYASGSFWSLWWFLRFAVGMEHKYAEVPPHPIFPTYNEWMRLLMETPRGPEVLRRLDELIPKSQALVARKPAIVSSASSFGGPTWRPGRLKRFFRDGAVRLGGLDIRWNVRRAPAPPPS